MAADALVRLKFDSKEYDSKIERARRGLLDLESSLQKTGQSFADADAEQVAFIRELGKMPTTANSAKASLGELSKAYTDLSLQYKRMTDEEKNSPAGKAMAESLAQLKTRIAETSRQIEEVNKDLGNTTKESNGASGALDALAGKFGLNIKQLAGWGAAVGAATAALQVAKDAFFANEQSLDEWGRIVESSESLYKGFLDALNTGDFNGYLQRIGEITRAARDAYNALDELNTFNAFNQINVERARTSMTESIVDFREGNATKETVNAAGEAYKKELEERKKLEREAYLKKVAEVAADRGVSAEDLTTALSGKYGSYKALKELPLSGKQTVVYGGGMFGGGGSYEKAIPSTIEEKLGDALRRLNDEELKNLQALGAQAERTGNEIAQVDRQISRALRGSRGGSSGGGTTGEKLVEGGIQGLQPMTEEVQGTTRSMRDLQATLKYFQDMLATATTTQQYQAATSGIASIQKQIGVQQMALQLGIDTESLATVQDELTAWMNETRSSLPKLDFGKGLTQEGKNAEKSWQAAAQAVNAVGGALQNVEDPAVKVAGLIAQAIASIALTFAQSLKGTVTPWDWIAAAAAGTATMISTIAAIKSATAGSYANGGIVPGNSYSGDRLTANVNSGELILSVVQQNRLASELMGRDASQRIQLSAVIDGEQILLVQNNRGMRMGNGEIVQSKRR